jgi:hypothetical protein
VKLAVQLALALFWKFWAEIVISYSPGWASSAR